MNFPIPSSFMTILIRFIGINNLTYMYVHFRYYWLLTKETFYSKIISNITRFFRYFIPYSNNLKQELIDIKLLSKNLKGKTISHSLREKIPPKKSISLSDIHNAIQNNVDTPNLQDSNIEITYKIGCNCYVYTFPIYISQSSVLTGHIDTAIFPIHTDDDLDNIQDQPEYIYANFTILNNHNTIEYDCPDLLRMYSGPHGNFYQDRHVITITNNHKLTKVPYKLSIDMVNLSHSSLNKSRLTGALHTEHQIISIDALRDDNVDINVDLEKKTLFNG